MVDGILLVNKPEGFTSFDVIAKLRGILKTKKMGHAGTLDPMATGVLPVFAGKATRAIPFLEDHDKSYTATFRLGEETDTQDITGTVVMRSQAPVNIRRETVEAILPSFKGILRQQVPMYSAVQVDGKRLYDLARKGIEVERPVRQVEVYELDLLAVEEERAEYTIHVACAKGTYIRTLCADIGRALGCGAVLIRLVRTRACGYPLEKCHSLEAIEGMAREGDMSFIAPIDTAFSQWDRVALPQEQARQFLNGVGIPIHIAGEIIVPENKLLRVYCDELFLGLAQREGDFLRSRRIFAQGDLR